MKRLGSLLRGILALLLLLFALFLISDTLEGHLRVWSLAAATLLLLGFLARRRRKGSGPTDRA